MKELTEDSLYDIRRCGYANSGFVFYFVRCHSRKALGDYVAKLPGGVKFEAGKEPYGYSYSRWTEALPGTLPEAHGPSLWEAYIIVAASGIIERDELITPREERRHWYHEIGHTAEAFADEYDASYDTFLSNPRVMQEPATEAAAYCNEFLGDALDLFLSGSDEPASSGLPFIMPWCDAAKAGGAE